MEGVQCVGDYMIRYKIREPPKKTENIVFLGSNFVKKIPHLSLELSYYMSMSLCGGSFCIAQR